MKTKFLLFSIFCTVLFSCKKDDEITISTTPELNFVSISPTTATEYQDKITIVITYKDGDGDLGENAPDVKNLFLTDTRNNVTYQYRISQLAPSGQAIAIQGTLAIELKNTAIINGSTSESVTYSIYAKDRAGNVSNTISTSAITLTQ
ncbi:MAG: hypothetical protein WBM13_10510 [Bacteroidia bacterium]